MKAVWAGPARRTIAATAALLLVALVAVVLAMSAHIHLGVGSGVADQHCNLCDLSATIFAEQPSASPVTIPVVVRVGVIRLVARRYEHARIATVLIRPPPAPTV